MESQRKHVIAWNMSGRFNGREIREYGHKILGAMLQHHNATLFLGQQMNFKAAIPAGFEQIGTGKSFILYDKSKFRAGQERQFRQVIRDLQFMGKLPQHYLPDTNYAVCKFRSRDRGGKEFIAMSWVTDECFGRAKSQSLFKKIIAFAVNLSILEEQPILMAGTFRIDAKTIKKCLPIGFSCYDYTTRNPRRLLRMSNLFVASSEFQLSGVRPVLCTDLDVPVKGTSLLRPEDAFYFDPVLSSLRLTGVDSMARPLTFVQPQPGWQREKSTAAEDEDVESASESGDDHPSSCDSCAPRSRFPRSTSVQSQGTQISSEAGTPDSAIVRPPLHRAIQAEPDPDMNMEQLLTEYMNVHNANGELVERNRTAANDLQIDLAAGHVTLFDGARISPTDEQTTFNAAVHTAAMTSSPLLNGKAKGEEKLASCNECGSKLPRGTNNNQKPDLLKDFAHRRSMEDLGGRKVGFLQNGKRTDSELERSTVDVLKKVKEDEETDSLEVGIVLSESDGSSSPEQVSPLVPTERSSPTEMKVFQQVARENNHDKKWKSEMVLDIKPHIQPACISMEVLPPSGRSGSDLHLPSGQQSVSAEDLRGGHDTGSIELTPREMDESLEEGGYVHLYPNQSEVNKNRTCYLS